jgi:VWFA-related protein
VLVPVVVRDAQGQPIGNLTKDDFQLFDKGKRQSIGSFSAIDREKGLQADGSAATVVSPRPAGLEQATYEAGNNRSNRHLIYLFDDANIRFADMANVRAAAVHFFKNSLSPGDRAAIYTLSGNPTLEFTGDREKLENAVSKLRWLAAAGHGGTECPDVSYYVADSIVVKGDSQALAALTNHTAECAHVPLEVARGIAFGAANRELVLGAQETQVVLRTLRRAIRRLSGLPGQRLIVLASPGFFAQTPEAIKATTEVLDLAAKSNIIISGLSVRGIIVAEEEEDVTRRAASSRRPPSLSSPSQLWLQYRRESARANSDVMKELAEGTGGTLFHNNNDLLAGFGQVTATPKFSYVLGFSPTDLRTDGSFHSLKVRLPNQRGAYIEARRGYHAIQTDSKDTEATAHIDDALFSRDERREIPVVLQTGYSKPNNGDTAKVLIVGKIDVTSLRSRESLSVAVALFDSDGGYVTGIAESVNLNLFNETLGSKDPALTLRWSFDAKPGTYTVRFVLREPEGAQMTTLNRILKIL